MLCNTTTQYVYNTMRQHIASTYYIKSYHIISRSTTLLHVTSHHVTSHHITTYYTSFLTIYPCNTNRYKNVEDPNDREDLFNDFVSELRKKVQEDKAKHRDNALRILNSLYEDLQLKSKSCLACVRS